MKNNICKILGCSVNLIQQLEEVACVCKYNNKNVFAYTSTHQSLLKIKFILLKIFFLLNTVQGLSQSLNDNYEKAKLEILCKTTQFIIAENINPNSAESLNCKDLSSLFLSIPPESNQAIFIFNMFKSKNYISYGKNKINARLEKLIKDIHTELTKLNNDDAWLEDIKVLHIQLNDTKAEILEQIQKGVYQKDTLKIENNNQINISTPQKNNTLMYILIFFSLFVSIGGIGFLAWQNQKIKKQLEESEAFFQEKYSRLDNRIDMMTNIKDFHGLLLKFNFLNEQLNSAIQEIMVLKTRNELKISPQELYTKRTEHLEKQIFNPNVQIYYSKYRPDLQGFNPQEFKTEPSRDSIYKIELNLNSLEQAFFSVVDRSEFHNIALLNPIQMLSQACEYVNEPYNDSKIITLEKGVLEKKENQWVILKKVKISFE